MTYKDYEIFARVWGSHSDLYTLDESGDLLESLDIIVDNEDREVLWFEVELHDGEMFETVDDAKKFIDKQKKGLR